MSGEEGSAPRFWWLEGQYLLRAPGCITNQVVSDSEKGKGERERDHMKEGK